MDAVYAGFGVGVYLCVEGGTLAGLVMYSVVYFIMGEPVKYLKIVGDLLSLYQRELIRLYKKCSFFLSQILTKSPWSSAKCSAQ